MISALRDPRGTRTPQASPRSAPARPAAPRPALRLVIRPAPPREPPFDDELTEPPIAQPYDVRLPFEVPAPPPVRIVAMVPSTAPEPRTWARRLLIGLIETADGRRPLAQLTSMLSPSIGRGLGSDLERANACGRPHWLHRASVRTVRATHPAPNVAEVSATVEAGRRVRAVALRLELRHGNWQCTRLQLG